MKPASRLLVLAALLLCCTLPGRSSNTKTTVSQVTGSVTIADDVDYTVTSATPFTATGSVNITNTEHAVLILQDVKPSKALDLVAAHVTVNGQAAQNGVNCQVRLYDHGTIVFPYAADAKPLTVYSEQNFEGDQSSDFGLEDNGGYMNTLTSAKLNNRIRSFKLKRGYMVTFALRPGGRGYSRCFIAADRDLEMATLPAILDGTISSYRIFKWYNTSKKGLANDTRAAACEALNVTSCYSFGLGEDRGIDCECVPHHIYEDWPSAAACGRVTYSPHLKTNNEPGNSADDHPQTVDQILANWENLMATGMRLCSPSSHDGSLAHLRAFMDSIDARGWRCDIIDLHCYWPEGSFSEWSFKTQWVDRYHRPIWISEWVWGASWNSNGAFASGVTETQNADAVKRICANLNSWDYIERYYYWNSERDPSRIYKDGTLTEAGRYYAAMHTGVGYNGRYDFAPKTPRQGSPTDLTVDYDKATHTATLRWYEPNGELNKRHVLQRRLSESSRWQDLYEPAKQDAGANYTYRDTEAAHGYQYRVYVEDFNSKARNTKTVTALSDKLDAGDPIAVGERTVYVGGNMLVNGDFDLGLHGWTDGNGQPLTGQPYFQVPPMGGTDGGSYLQAYGHGTNTTNPEQSVLTTIDIEPQTDYYASAANCNSVSSGPRIGLVDADGTLTSKLLLNNREATWATQKTTFNSEANAKLQVWLRNLSAKAQFDKLILCRLFDTEAEALADGLKWARARAEAFMAYNTSYPTLNTGLAAATATAQTAAHINSLIDAAIKAYDTMPLLSERISHAEALLPLHLYGEEALQAALEEARTAATAAEIVAAAETLQQAIGQYLPYTQASGLVKSPSFANTADWTVKCGTYTGGDQRTNMKEGINFWNAWWAGIDADEGEAQTMEVRQSIANSSLNSGYSHGLYALACKATTEHYCLSDQHAYIYNGTETATSPRLTADYYDLPTITKDERWQTLTTTPVYLADNSELTIGFTGSKQGATDNAWHEIGNTASTGDQREGWWCATDFTLYYHPAYRTTAVPGQWGVVCLPYALHPSKAITYYQIAGVSPDYTRLCVEPVEEAAAGVPVIYKASEADVTFCEYGEVTLEPGEAQGGLRGYFTTGRATAGYYILQDGQWNKVSASSRPSRGRYNALIRPFGTAGQVPVLSDWTGETIPLNGVTDEEIASNILLPSDGGEQGTVYTIDGRRVSDSTLHPGVYVKMVNGRSYKFKK